MNKEELLKEFNDKVEELKKELLEKLEQEKVKEKKPFEVELPEDGEVVYFIDLKNGDVFSKYFNVYNMSDIKHFENGLYFETREEAERFLKESKLIFKLKQWAKIHNEGWEPDWYNGEEKFRVDVRVKEKLVNIRRVLVYDGLVKLPHFKTREIAQACIDKFGEEIKEVLF